MKKIVSIVLSCLVVFCMLSCVNATTLDETTDAGKTKIEYSVGETYTVVIPEEIVVAKNTETPVEYSVVVKDLLIPYGSSLDVSVEYEGKLKLFEHSATTLGYQIIKSSDSSVLSNGDKVISVPAGTVEEQTENLTAVLTETPVIAGNYEDIATFKINVDGGESQYGEAIQMWNISATDKDDVWMTYYQPKATTFNARATTTELYEDGTVYITGKGNMEASLYNYFLDFDKIKENLSNFCKTEYGYYVRVDEKYDNFNSFLTDIDNVVLYINDETAGDLNGTQLYEDWGTDWQPDFSDTSLYKFVPTNLIIDEGVTNVSDMAFIYNKFTNIELPSTIKTIGYGAFAVSSELESIALNDGLETIGEFAFQRIAPETITIPQSVTNIAETAFFESNIKTIKGVTGSCAESFANSNGYTFVAI